MSRQDHQRDTDIQKMVTQTLTHLSCLIDMCIYLVANEVETTCTMLLTKIAMTFYIVINFCLIDSVCQYVSAMKSNT